VAADLVIVISALPERDDRGFTLVEVIVSLGILTVVMTSLSVFIVNSRRVGRYSSLQDTAIQLAVEGMEKTRGVRGSALLSGRGQCDTLCAAVVSPQVSSLLGAGVTRWDAAGSGTLTVPQPGSQPDGSVVTTPAAPEVVQLDGLDVTANTVDYAFMVIFSCKQAPNKVIQWNQVWFLPSVPSGQGRVYVKGSDGTSYYCLYSPGSIAAGQYVRITPCTLNSPIPADQMWKRSVFTGVNQTSYRIESTFGTTTSAPYCLMPSPTDYWNQFTAMKISKLVLGACNGSNLHKWNASPSILTSVISDYQEK